ncbi:hypothetical protein [Nostoc sp. ChiSLP03a]|uniref:hypothetical protein n=1 Tax=Nostoc sp. ChiSLP03a TaxID=3075380 RepID=UPI002AD50FBA|nr:hypothetical protein [Nostoc sp. ChiSLP03a]MDZ8216509.1 hypothetical protein [Nostoc sp. ChiSLP03a]
MVSPANSSHIYATPNLPMRPSAMPIRPLTLKMLCFYAKLYLGRSREFAHLNGGL